MYSTSPSMGDARVVMTRQEGRSGEIHMKRLGGGDGWWWCRASRGELGGGAWGWLVGEETQTQQPSLALGRRRQSTLGLGCVGLRSLCSVVQWLRPFVCQIWTLSSCVLRNNTNKYFYFLWNYLLLYNFKVIHILSNYILLFVKIEK